MQLTRCRVGRWQALSDCTYNVRHGGMHALLCLTWVSLGEVVQFAQYWLLQLIWLCGRHQPVTG
jgi:hypothetical protein